MPGVSRTQRAEAKYNVTLEFPNLGLHSAAASGNLGLVKYALDHGQPINSVVDGVLPLHAACSGGNDLVVKLLIEKGADVNAPRLPRRYSSDRNRDNSAPIVGTSGSTPLHFACANGNISVVLTLLLHGAHPDRPDKHGVTPEMVARQNGWIAAADVVREWSHNKDKDLREREARSGVHTPSGEPLSSKEDQHAYCGSSGCKECSTWKRLRGKQSIDNVLNVLRPSMSQTPSSSSTVPSFTADSPDPSVRPLGQYTSYDTPDVGTADELPPRRPSLPHAFAAPDSASSRKSYHHPGSSSRRPRSAGTDADTSSTHHKIKGKISLLSIFKKNVNDLVGSPETHSGSSSAITSTSGSPATTGLATSPLAPSSEPLFPLPSDVSSIGSSSVSKTLSSMYSDSDSSSIHPPLAVELHNRLSKERLRTRSASSSSAGTDSLPVNGPGPSQHTRRPPVRPSILRPHARSSSSGQTDGRRRSSAGQSSLRALRFDSSSSGGSPQIAVGDRSPSRSIPANAQEDGLDSKQRSPRNRSRVRSERHDAVIDEDAAHVTTEPEEVFEEDEDEYGEPIPGHVDIPRVRSRLSQLKIEDSPRRHSTASSRSSSSALPSPSSPVSPEIVVPTVAFDCPFSINHPPPADPEPDPEPAPSNLLGIHGVDRPRGDSVSSISTNASVNPASSSGASGYITTPALSHSHLPPAVISSPDSNATDFVLPEPLSPDAIPHKGLLGDVELSLSPKVSRIPLDIDIRSISSHAQAEALVQRAQRSILEMHDDESQDVDVGCQTLLNGLGAGRTPLSAKLAAYGQTLEIERKFKEEQRRIRSLDLDERARAVEGVVATSPETPIADATISSKGLERKFSLEERPRLVHGPRQSRSRRPHTAGGTPSSGTLGTSPSLGTPSTLGASSSDGVTITSRALSTPRSRSRLPAESALSKTDHFRSVSATITPPPSTYLQLEAQSSPRHIRSRTPEPSRSRLPPLDVPAFGVPLTRIATAPAQDTFQDFIPSRALTEQERQVARANKLAKMGFQSSDTWQHTAAGNPRGQSSSKHRFGIKNLVQSLKGKP
ncbi:hypothetical protein CERSUDRAFT_114247 [Gelatoporia subvermispora B]|uniref:Uncharacterized protein n=1 Tax=Ceriporiopsis subvermispora (strain B) TaxID=914234 RepID=M2PMI0_CERS8|nr:hypothetical protein CERSUDRAFT_114247 [Gelatoporia subvermispora B]